MDQQKKVSRALCFSNASPVVSLGVHNARVEANDCPSRGTPLQPDAYTRPRMLNRRRRQRQTEPMPILAQQLFLSEQSESLL